MKVERKSVFTVLLACALIVVLLAGCSGGSNETASPSASTPAASSPAASSPAASSPAASSPAASESSAASEAPAVEYPIVIKHAFGETVIESKPERIATVAWANHDVVLALGVVPVGFSAANFGVEGDNVLLPWTAQKLEELGVSDPNVYMDTDGLDYEAISDSDPDVILAAYSGLTQEHYDLLSQIAPVVAYQSQPWVTDWREQITFNSLGMGMKAEGEQLIADLEALIKEKSAQYPNTQGKTAAFASFSVDDLSSFYVYTPTDPRGAFLTELGMPFAAGLTAQLKDDSGFYLQLSAENADALADTDIIVSYGEADMLAALQADPLIGKIPAIKRGSIVFVGSNSPLAAAVNPNALSIGYTIDEYLKLIGEAADKVNG